MKTCFKCGSTKSLVDFYKHPQMADGHLGKCKECAKADVMRNREENSEYYKAYDRQRGQLPERKEAVRSYQARYINRRAEWTRAFRAANPQKYQSHTVLNNAIRKGIVLPQPCVRCGLPDVHGHHEDYTKPLDVIWLCPFHHGEWHREINEQRRATGA